MDCLQTYQMERFMAFLLVFLCLGVRQVQCIRFELPSGQTKCIAEEIQSNVLVLGNYHVVAPGSDEHHYGTGNAQPVADDHKITVRVTSPYGNSLHYADKVESGQFALTTTESGDYMACFWILPTQHPITASVELEWKTGVFAKDWAKIAMLVGAYPFEDQDDPKNFRKTIQRIMSVQYTIPDYVHVSPECKQLLGRIFVANPHKRITIRDIRQHPWFLKNLPRELMEGADAGYMHDDYNNPPQPIDEIVKIIEEAKVPLPTPKTLTPYLWDEDEEEQEGQEGAEEEFYADEDEVEAYEREKGAQERVGGAQERGDVRVRFQEVPKAHDRAERTHDRADVQVRGAERAYDRADVQVRGAERAYDRADVHVRGAERAERTSYYQPSDIMGTLEI